MASNKLSIPINNNSLESSIIVDWHAKSVSGKLILLPEKFNLMYIYPNPFNPSATIPFALPEDSKVKIIIYDLLGNLVVELKNEQYRAGIHKINWYPENLSSGLYLVYMETEKYIGKQKILYLK